MILNKEKVLKYKECIKCIDDNDGEEELIECKQCKNRDIASLKAVDLCETLENTWNDIDKLKEDKKKLKKSLDYIIMIQCKNCGCGYYRGDVLTTCKGCKLYEHRKLLQEVQDND